MTALLDATADQMAMLADLTDALQAAEAAMSSMAAARDGMLALAGRIALEIAQQGAHADHGDMTIRAVAADIGAAQRVSDRTIERRMAEATWLVERFPAVWAAQGAGRISAAHSRAIVEAGAHLDDTDQRTAFAAEVLPYAMTESPNRVRRLARRAAEHFRERSLTERHQQARAQRRVWVVDGDDGMADLRVHAAAALVHGMMDRLTQQAHLVHAAADGTRDDTRTIDQLRADLLTDLVLTGAPHGHDAPDALLAQVRAHIEVTVPVLTLMSSDPDAPLPPAELDGRTPIDAETARVLAGAASGWTRVLTHPISGAMLSVDRYRPSEHLRRHLRTRDQRCRFPGCGLAARRCDIDHNHAASSGGKTRDDNLADFCRRHHMLKHHSPWHVVQRPGGVLEWTSPTGRHYVDRPPAQNTVRFVDAAAPF